MTKDDLLKQMTFDSEDEKAEAVKYINIKGIIQYRRAIDFCIADGKSLPSYKQVSSLYRYDKRLRDTLYEYIATVEEYIRAIIGNQFEDNQSGLNITPKLQQKLEEYKSLSLALEQLMISELKDIVLANKTLFKNDFTVDDDLSANLRALKTLRNKVGHHNFLLAEKYDKCAIGGKSATLEVNIKNLQQFLPLDFRKGFASSIRNCAKNLLIDKKYIIDIEPLIISNDKIEKLSQQIFNLIKKDANEFATFMDSVYLAVYDEEWKHFQDTLYYKALNAYCLDLEWAGTDTEERLLNLYRICCPQFNLMFDMECVSQKKLTKLSYKAVFFKFSRKYDIIASSILGVIAVIILLILSFGYHQQDPNSWYTSLFMGLASSILAATIIMTVNKGKRKKARKSDMIVKKVVNETNQFFININETYKCFQKSKENNENEFALHYVDIDNLIHSYYNKMRQYGLQECTAFNKLKLLEDEMFQSTSILVQAKGKYIENRGFVILSNESDRLKATEQIIKLKLIIDDLKWQVEAYLYSLNKELIKLEDTLL